MAHSFFLRTAFILTGAGLSIFIPLFVQTSLRLRQLSLWPQIVWDDSAAVLNQRLGGDKTAPAKALPISPVYLPPPQPAVLFQQLWH